MKNKMKTFSVFLLAIVIGFIFAKYIFNQYEEEVNETFKENTSVYLFQYGAYKNENIMKDNCKDLSSYFYYKNDNMYHVLIGISSNKENLDKIKKAYNINSDIYVKKEEIKNNEFIESLKQYDNLIKSSDDSATIINAEKQVLAKYESLVLNSEQIAY